MVVSNYDSCDKSDRKILNSCFPDKPQQSRIHTKKQVIWIRLNKVKTYNKSNLRVCIALKQGRTTK